METNEEIQKQVDSIMKPYDACYFMAIREMNDIERLKEIYDLEDMEFKMKFKIWKNGKLTEYTIDTEDFG